MASATGIPNGAVPREQIEGVGEDEPLLGRAGDASQQEGRPLYYNLVIGNTVFCTPASLLFVRSNTAFHHNC